MVKKTVNTETVKETAKKTAEVVKQAAKETGAAAKKAAKETSTVAKKAAKETADSVKKTAKETSTATKRAVKETSAVVKETTAAVKKTAKKEYTKLALKETYIQVAGNEYKETEILKKVEESFLAAGHKITSMKNLQLYVKPEDGAAYYVVNGEITGRVDL